MIESGKLAERPPGVVQLPPELASATWDGFVYVARLPKGRLYLFKTVALPLRPFNIRGYIYSTGPLDTLSNETDSEGHPWLEGKFVDWQSAQDRVPAVTNGLSIRQTIGDHWFRLLNYPGDGN